MVILVQFFWFSFIVVGAAIILFLLTQVPYLRKPEVRQLLKSLPPPAQVFLAFAIAFCTFAMLVIPAYLLQLPVMAGVVAYLVILAISLGYLLVYVRIIRKVLIPWRPTTKTGWLALIIIGGVVAMDYILSVRNCNGLLDWDAAVHVARINFIAHSHFGLSDPYFGNHGVVDPRYSTNLLLGLQAVAARLLNISAVQVWQYSYGFFRLLIWLSLFFLTWGLLDDQKVRRRWAYGILLISPLLLGYFFANAEFPDRIVYAWVSLLIVALKYWLEVKPAALLLLGASLLIAVTHPINALMAIGFLCLMAAVLAVRKRLSWPRLGVVIVAVALLSFPVVLNLSYPNLTSLSPTAFNAGAISGNQFKPHNYGIFTISVLPHLTLWYLLVYAVILGALWATIKIHRKWLRAYLFILASLLALLNYIPAYISVIGYYLVLKRISNKQVRAVIVLLILYYGLLAYNPLFVSLVAGKVPPWAIARFQEFNVLGLIAPYLAWLALLEWPLLKWGAKRATIFLYILTIPIFIFWSPVFDPGQDMGRFILPGKAYSFEQTKNKSIVTNLQTFIPELQNQTVYSNIDAVSFYIPAAVPGAHVVWTLDTNYAPMANIPRRDACAKALSRNLLAKDLAAAGVTRVVTSSDAGITTNTGAALYKLADSRPYLRLVGNKGTYRVYAVTLNSQPQSSSVCTIPWGQ